MSNQFIHWDSTSYIGEYPKIIKKVFDYFYLRERTKYNYWIKKISYNFSDDLDWIVSPPISRNIYSTNLYKNICILKTLEVLEKKYYIKIVVESLELKKIVNLYFDKKKINLIIKKNMRYFLSFFYFLYIFRALILFLTQYLVIGINIKNKIKINKNSILFDTYIIDSINKEKIYYGDILDNSKKYKKKIIFIPTIITNNLFNFCKIVKELTKNKSFIFKEQFIKFQDLIFCFMYLIRKKKFNVSYPFYKKFNLSKLIFNEINTNKDLYSIFLSLYNYCFVKRLKEKNLKFKKVVNWFENQCNDKSWNFAFRKYYKNVKVFGYQGFTHYPEYMNTMPIKFEEDLKIIPEKIIVINKNYKKLRRTFFPNLKILNGPALRFQNIFSKDLNNYERNYNVVIFLEGASKYIDREILLKIINVSKKLGNLVFYLKPHPALPIKKLNLNLPKNFIILNHKFSEIAINSKIVISYGNTSATLESLAYGCKLIIPTKNVFDAKIITDLRIPKNLYRICYTELDIYNAILFFLRKKTIKNSINVKIRDNLFNKVNKKNLSVLF
jgi:hypothetical protein